MLLDWISRALMLDDELVGRCTWCGRACPTSFDMHYKCHGCGALFYMALKPPPSPPPSPQESSYEVLCTNVVYYQGDTRYWFKFKGTSTDLTVESFDPRAYVPGRYYALSLVEVPNVAE